MINIQFKFEAVHAVPELIGDRQKLVSDFNNVVGSPGAAFSAWQAKFIAGAVPVNQAVAYVRYAKFMLERHVDRIRD